MSPSGSAGVEPDETALLTAVFNPARLAAVAATGLLDSAPEGAFDDLAHLALAITGAQMAFFTVADGRRSFWKSAVGVDPALGRQEAIGNSPTHLLIASRGPLIVEDARTDARTRDLPAIDTLGIGAWAGFPVVSPEGHVLGGFCVVDAQQRTFTPAQITALQTLARSVSSEIALRQALHEAQAAQEVSAQLARTSAALARTLQDSLLPPRLPTVAGMDVAAVYLPADATGAQVVGDFYDLFPVPEESWCAVMGDVSGKGVEAAKVTALARYTIRTEATQHPRPAAVLRRLHQALVDQQITNRFLTIALAVLRPQDGGVSGYLASGGHPPALIRRADGGVEEIHAPGTLLSPLLTPEEIHLTETAFHLHPGDALLLYTDGITEARLAQGHPMFGDSALANTLAATHGLDARTTVAHLHATVATHTHGKTSDDTALMLLRVIA